MSCLSVYLHARQQINDMGVRQQQFLFKQNADKENSKKSAKQRYIKTSIIQINKQ